MKKTESIPTNKQLINIAEFINKELENVKNNDISITFNIDKDLLRQVDEEYFFITNKNAKESDFKPSPIGVDVIIRGTKFKFITDTEND